MVSEELDLAVLEFLEEELAAGRVVRNKDLSTRALEIAGKPSFFSDCFEQIACMLVRVCVLKCVCVRARVCVYVCVCEISVIFSKHHKSFFARMRKGTSNGLHWFCCLLQVLCSWTGLLLPTCGFNAEKSVMAYPREDPLPSARRCQGISGICSSIIGVLY